jgi:transposase
VFRRGIQSGDRELRRLSAISERPPRYLAAGQSQRRREGGIVVEGVFAGIDWASAEHAVCVVDADGRVVEARRYRHDERGIKALCAWLLALEVRLVAIERPDGLLVERLLDAGVPVVAVHPNQLAAMRPRYTAAGGKSDSFDSFVLAELARTDSHRFRLLVPDSDATKALRALSRAREDLVEHRVALGNELRAQLDCFWPGAARVFAEIDSPISLAFLKRYPSPADARGLGEQRMQRFLARHHYCGRKPPRELLARLRASAEGRAGQLETEARRQVVLALVATLEPLVARISELTSEIRGALADHLDGPTFRSLFNDPKSAVAAASMLSEMGDCRDRYPTCRTLAADAGQAAVAVESGRSKRARFRWACDHRLRAAIGVLADSSRHHNPWAADIYQRARARGKTHQHAIRILGRAWCGVIWRLWHDHDVYDPARHTALQRVLAVTTN